MIDVDDLSVAYGPLVAVDHLSMSADAGEVVALLGPNGAGKTTTVEVLEGFRRPTSGHVRVAGLDPQADHAALTREIGVMLQNGGVYAGIRPLEMINLFAAFYDDAEDPEYLLERVGLGPRRRSRWRDLSGGEQQRLSLALAVVGRPRVAFLDEPTAGVDVAGRRLIRTMVADLRSRGVCVLLTTHELDEAEKMADRIVIVDRGQVLATGAAAELTAPTANDEIRFRAEGGIDTAALAAAVDGVAEEVSPGDYVVAIPPTPDNVASITAWLARHDLVLGDLRAGRQRLEDVFIRLTERDEPEPPVEVPSRRRRPRR